MDKSREDFEAWFLKEMDIDVFQYRNHDPRTNVEWPYDGGNQLTSQVFTVAFKSWQASRKALVVELPKQGEVTGSYDTEAFWVAVERCEDAIRAVGITVKGEGDDTQS